MQFLKEDETAAIHALADAFCGGLSTHERVLWLVSGGSNIATEKAVMDVVRDRVGNLLDRLAIMPMDERYGKPGHKDSNVQQLRAAGFDPGAATLIDPLVHNRSFDQTVQFYADITATVLANAGTVIAQFGMGADGHVAGIKPGSPAIEPSEAMVVGYDWNDYRRMTLTPAAFRRITTGFLVAYGTSKKKSLTQLEKHTLTLQSFPAVLLYELPDIRVYNNYIESEG